MQASVDHAELRAILGASAGVVIMCPDSDDAAVKEALDVAFSELSPKKHKVAVAESFGGNDEPVDKLSADLVALGLDPLVTLRVKAEPTESVRVAFTPAPCERARALCPSSLWCRRAVLPA